MFEPGGSLAEKGPLATISNPLANTWKKTEMMVNLNVDSYTNLHHRKIFRKT